MAQTSRVARTLTALLVTLGTVLFAIPPLHPATAQAASPDLVISQVYGGGGNSGATYKNDFVELFNRGPGPVTVTGWSVQYASSSGSTWQVTALSGIVQPGRYYLVQQAAGAGGTLGLPAPDAAGSIPMSASAGKVALVTHVTPLTCGATASSCLPSASIRDFVGFGGASNFEGTASAPTLGNSTAALRVGDGCTDSDVNGSDFKAAAPAPRNSASPARGCASDATQTPTPTATTPAATATSTPTPVPPTFIHQIQGAGHRSPLIGSRPGNVPGVVTARRSNGFYMQDPSGDGDDRTSEGIFVFTGSGPNPVQVGDLVSVAGTVGEFRPGSDANNLTTTQLTSPVVTVRSNGLALPSPVVIGASGRVPPPAVIEDDAADVETTGAFDPTADGIDFYESLEGMLVRVDDPVAVGPTSGFGELPVVAGDSAGPRTARGGVLLRPGDANPERVHLDDEVLRVSGAAMPAANVGDRLTGSVVGVVDYSFGNFKVHLLAAPGVAPGGIAREVTTPQGTDELAVATFNVENLDPSDGPAKFDALARVIVDNLRSPDLVALEEVQDNNGAANDAVVDASATLDTLAQAIRAAGGPPYQYRLVDPVDDKDGGEPGGNIRVAFLFRTDRGLAFVDRPGAGPTTPNAVLAGPSGPQLAYSPGRIDPTNTAFNSSRKPLAGEFTFNGHRLFVVANHFNSKGGDQPLFGRFQPPTRGSEVQRHQQATIVHDFVAQIAAADPNANVVVLGDINDFEFSQTVAILKGSVMNDLLDTMPLGERYSYVFEGNSQSLDHILVSNNLLNNTPFAYDVVHVNAEFHDQISDHDPQVVRLYFDPSAPVITPTVSGTVGQNGWYTSDVDVAWSVTDPESAVRSTTGCGATTLGADTAGTTLTCAASSQGGTASASVTIRRDATPPTVTYAGALAYTADQTVAITCTPADNLAGLASHTCADVTGPAYSFDLGPNTRTAAATDAAGNVGTGSVLFTVTASEDSLCTLTRRFIAQRGIANSLCAKLDAADAAARRGDAEARASTLAAYRHELAAQAGKALTRAAADVLTRLSLAL